MNTAALFYLGYFKFAASLSKDEKVLSYIKIMEAGGEISLTVLFSLNMTNPSMW